MTNSQTTGGVEKRLREHANFFADDPGFYNLCGSDLSLVFGFLGRRDLHLRMERKRLVRIRGGGARIYLALASRLFNLVFESQPTTTGTD